MSEPLANDDYAEDLVLEYDCDEIFQRHAATLRPFVVRRKKWGPLTVLGHDVVGPYRGKLSGLEQYSIVIHEPDGVDIEVGAFRVDEIDGIDEGEAPHNQAS